MKVLCCPLCKGSGKIGLKQIPKPIVKTCPLNHYCMNCEKAVSKWHGNNYGHDTHPFKPLFQKVKVNR